MQFSEKNKYDSKFDDFMSKNKVSESDKQQRIKQANEELEQVSHKAKQEAEDSQKRLKNTKKAFEDFSTTKGADEMNLKDVFKNINFKEQMTGVSNMFDSVRSGASKKANSILELRKQLFKEKKEAEVEKVVKQEMNKAAGQGKKQEKSVDESKDGAAEAKTEKKNTLDQEPKVSALSKLQSTVSGTTQTINQKAPIIYKTGLFIKDLWQETFPKDDNKVRTRLQKRKEVAKEQALYSEEEIKQMQDDIPDWKRTAVTMVDDDKVEERESGFVGKLYKKVGSSVSDSSIGKKIFESEEYKDFKKKYRTVRQEADEFREDFKDEVETTQNPVVGSARTVTDYLFKETDLAKAITKMKAYDPEFDILDLTYEIEEIFTDFFNGFLEGNLEYLQTFSDEQALAIIKGDLQRRKKEGWEYKFKEMLF
jgi:hypothetical protein